MCSENKLPVYIYGPVVLKKCSMCDEYKTLDQYNPCGKRLSGPCKPCAVAYSVAWAKRNPERRREVCQGYLQRNPERRKETMRAYYANHREQVLGHLREYRKQYPERRKATVDGYNKRNPDKIRALQNRRRARLVGNGGSHTAEDERRLFVLQGGRCANLACRVKLKRVGHHVDHIIPLVLGGTDYPENIQLLCPTCNQRKHAKPPEVWAAENGLLF